MSDFETAVAILGMGVITLLTRSFFLISDRELAMPDWVRRGLRYAPLAALTAVVAPEIVLAQGRLIDTWQDARLFGVLVGGAYFFWRRSILGTILAGMAVYLPLRLIVGW
jgi:branched-subunit amino acid transport protein